MNKKIAITGGRGRLARVAASYFRQQGYEVTVFSRQMGEGMKALADLFNPKILSSFDVLIHAAWSTVPFSSEADPGREEREDIPLLKNILESLHRLEQGESVPKFIFLSSAAVYGNQKKEPATELTLCKPLSRYARAKLFAERLILEAAVHDSRLNSVIFRITNLIGISSNKVVPQGILSKIVAAAKGEQDLEIWGDGKASKDYLWIDDFLEALKTAAEASVQGIFNIGSGKIFSIFEFVKLAEEVTHQTLSIKYHPHYSWDVNCSKISSAGFMEATGWKPQADIVKKIRELLK
ncbi:MAG: NAD-dependent epimerase/dehydratase family protein [Verrucomicrobia bacterium]|nr:NAD-dependent epimerase/dehydratase family protein [Verrucomicrobiota bacterium]